MDTLRIAIGTEPMQWIPTLVLQHSIRRRTQRPVEFSLSWSPQHGWHPLLQQIKRLIEDEQVFGGTGFNLWRWVVPELFCKQGRAIYLDTDQVVLEDIGVLWDELEGTTAAFAAVCDAQGIFGDKKKPEPGAVQTSVMVMNCQLCTWDARQLVQLCQADKVVHLHGPSGKSPYGRLMQATWWPREKIKELDPGWNHFGIHVPGQTKLLHWSHVGSQPYRKPDHPTADLFRKELKAALAAGVVTPADVETEIRKGHLHKRWAKI